MSRHEDSRAEQPANGAPTCRNLKSLTKSLTLNIARQSYMDWMPAFAVSNTLKVQEFTLQCIDSMYLESRKNAFRPKKKTFTIIILINSELLIQSI